MGSRPWFRRTPAEPKPVSTNFTELSGSRTATSSGCDSAWSVARTLVPSRLVWYSYWRALALSLMRKPGTGPLAQVTPGSATPRQPSGQSTASVLTMVSWSRPIWSLVAMALTAAVCAGPASTAGGNSVGADVGVPEAGVATGGAWVGAGVAEGGSAVGGVVLVAGAAVGGTAVGTAVGDWQ